MDRRGVNPPSLPTFSQLRRPTYNGQIACSAGALSIVSRPLPQGIETLDAALRQPPALRLEALRVRVAWLIAANRIAEAGDTAEAIVKEKPPGGDAQARAAVAFARLAARPGGEAYAARAIEMLQQSKAAGHFRGPPENAWLRWEPSFAALRGQKVFQEFVKEVSGGMLEGK
jgi:hypothetical protein